MSFTLVLTNRITNITDTHEHDLMFYVGNNTGLIIVDTTHKNQNASVGGLYNYI